MELISISKRDKLPVPMVSVIMNCLNCSEYLHEAIESVYAQTYQDWEIIFWDNASTDDSAEIAKSCDKRLRYFRSEVTVPLGKARNWAIEHARGKYIAFLDCDDRWMPQKIEKQVHILENRPDVDFLYGNYFRIIMPKSARLIPGLKGPQPEGHVFRPLLLRSPINMQTVMLRRSVLKHLDSVFDEKIELSEEYDLFMRILYKSKAVYCKEPMAVYRIHSRMSSLERMGLYPDEMEYIIGKLKMMDPLLELNYKSELRYFHAKIGYWRARAAMASGNPEEARKFLKEHRNVDFKLFMLYMSTYLPSFAWRCLHRMGGKIYY